MTTGAEDETALVTTTQICDELDVDRATLARWVNRGIAKPTMKLPGRGGAYLFDPSEITRLRVLRGGRKQMPRDVNEAAS